MLNRSCLLILWLIVPVAAGDPLPDASEKPVDFESQVLPLLRTKCFECHGPDLQESNYRLDVRDLALRGGDFGEPAIVPGKSKQSPLWAYVSGTGDLRMPPEDAGEPLKATEVAVIQRWINQGARWPDQLAGKVTRRKSTHWALQPVQKSELPPASDWAINPIDSFIESRLQAKGLSPSAEADRATLIRRVYLDMHGLLPTPTQVEEFLHDPRPDAYDRLVEDVLASPRYGERWAQHWLDVVRFAETNGFEVNTPRSNAWPYRDYVIRAFNEDKPYDEFVYEQLAGDLVGEDAATGFLVAAPVLLPGQIGKDKDSMLAARQDALDEIVSATSTTFLGFTVGCARCHNHKFDPILQRDYFSLQAVFAGVHYGHRKLDRPLSPERRRQLERLDEQIARLDPELAKHGLRPPINAERNDEKFSPVAARFVRFTIEATNNREPCLDELEIFSVIRDGQPPRNVALASLEAKATASGSYPNSTRHRLEHINDGRYGNGRSWISDEVGGGWVQIELAETTQIDRITWGRDREQVYKDRLPTRYRIDVAVEPDQWVTVASSANRLPYLVDASATELPQELGEAAWQILRERTRLQTKRAEVAAQAVTDVYAGTFAEPGRTFRLRRGDHRQPLEEVRPDTIEVLGTLGLATDASEAERRDALARWMVRPENPLTARVIVNRIWHYHFGTGLVDTPSDFGVMGSRPTHPDLLDHLATHLTEGGWSIKRVHRLILNSRTYRQAGNTENEAAERIDGNNRLLWRFPSRRLEAEAIRDCVLQVSGVLRHEGGGPGFQVFKPRQGLDFYVPKEEAGPAEWRRMIYAHKVRMANDGVFTAFDMPDCGQLCSKRSRSTTPLQALNLFNSRYIMQQAELFAQRIRSEAGDGVSRQVQHAFELSLTREPHPSEQAAAERLVREHGLVTLCRVLFNTNEFVSLP